MHENDTCCYNLESPAAGAPVAPGWQQLRGWLVPKRGFHFVDVRARHGDITFPGVYGFPRTDLAAHFDPARRWLPAEYTIEIELPSGRSDIGIEALDVTGKWQPVQTFSVIAEGTPAQRRTHDPLCVEEVGLALRLCLKQDGIADGPVSATVAASIPYPPVLRPNHSPFHGFIDEPAAIAPALYGRLHVLGWLFHETLAVKNVHVSTDLLVFQQLELGGDFAGVKERFPNFPKATNCRLFGFADVSSQFPSPVSARFYAELEDGSTHLVLAVQTRPVNTEELKAAFTPFSAKLFWCHWRNLRQAFADRRVPVEGGGKLLARVGKTFLQYRREAPPRLRARAAGGITLPPSASFTRKPRLLLISHNLNLEGAPLLFVEYARYLRQTCNAELLVVSGQEGPLRAAFASLGAEVGIVDPARLFAAASPAEFQSRVAELASAHGWRDVDAVVANTLLSFWGVELAATLGCPSLLYIHESTNPVAFFQERIPGKLLPAIFHAFAQATAVSFNTAATQRYYLPYATGKNFRLTPAWIVLSGIETYRATHRRSALRDQFHLESGERLVVNIGTVCDRKGQHDFLHAVEWLWRLQPELARRCRFALVGGRDTPHNRFLQQSIDDLGRANIAIVPETDRAYDYFAAADLFVCTSYEESFPRVVLEAMAFEVPIVSTDVHGIPFMLRADVDALLVKPGDSNALATAMRDSLENSTAAVARAKSARERVREYDAAQVLPQHAALTAAVIAAQP